MVDKSVGSIYDLVIRNGQIVDGTGAEGFEDIAVRDGYPEVGQVSGYVQKRLTLQVTSPHLAW